MGCCTVRALGDGGPVLFAFDPVSRAFLYTIPLPDGRPLDLGLQTGPDGKIYGFTTASFYEFDPTHRAITPLYEKKDAFQIPGPVMGNSVYFAKKARDEAVGDLKGQACAARVGPGNVIAAWF